MGGLKRGSIDRNLLGRGSLLTVAPLIVLGLAVFVIALNVRHHSSLCDTESVRDEALNRQAMERRIRTLENEILQNSLLMEKVLKGLDAAFEANVKLSVGELRRLAQTEAAEVGSRRARKPPPPMSDYARALVMAAVDGENLQDLVENALIPETSTFSDMKAEGGNEGWEWDAGDYADDFLTGNVVVPENIVHLDIDVEEREKVCRAWLAEHGVLPGIDWGTLPASDQAKWKEYRCDEVSLAVQAEEASAKKALANEGSENEALANERAANEASANEGGAENEASAEEEGAVSELSAGEAVAEEASAGEALADEAPAEDSPAEETSAVRRAKAKAAKTKARVDGGQERMAQQREKQQQQQQRRAGEGNRGVSEDDASKTSVSSTDDDAGGAADDGSSLDSKDEVALVV